jgi:hypothetical protein
MKIGITDPTALKVIRFLILRMKAIFQLVITFV